MKGKLKNHHDFYVHIKNLDVQREHKKNSCIFIHQSLSLSLCLFENLKHNKKNEK